MRERIFLNHKKIICFTLRGPKKEHQIRLSNCITSNTNTQKINVRSSRQPVNCSIGRNVIMYCNCVFSFQTNMLRGLGWEPCQCTSCTNYERVPPRSHTMTANPSRHALHRAQSHFWDAITSGMRCRLVPSSRFHALTALQYASVFCCSYWSLG